MTTYDTDPNTHTFYVIHTTEDNDVDAELVVTVTDEGIVCDVVVGGEVVSTWAGMAQDIADELCY